MNEREIIECLKAQTVEGTHGLLRGIGDDCAVIEKNGRQLWLVTMDTLVENVHFDLRWHSPEKLARKAISVNVSDVAAMGGEAVLVFLSLGLPKRFDPSWVNQFSAGIGKACRDNNCILAGGDTVSSMEGVLITVTVIGEIPMDQVVYRNGALHGDTVWVSGSLGMAAAGLEICRNGIQPETQSMKSLVESHLNPQPRVRLGRLLAENKVVNAMMDLSDGLATDLSHLCKQSGVGATIYSDKISVSAAIDEVCKLLRIDPLDLMIRGGEDYELLFTARDESAQVIEEMGEKAGLEVTPVGKIVEGKGVKLVLPASVTGEYEEIDISYSGFDHFTDR